MKPTILDTAMRSTKTFRATLTVAYLDMEAVVNSQERDDPGIDLEMNLGGNKLRLRWAKISSNWNCNFVLFHSRYVASN